MQHTRNKHKRKNRTMTHQSSITCKSNTFPIAFLIVALIGACLTMNSNALAQIKGCEHPCNLIRNGDFSGGNTGFTSDLPYKGNACSAGHIFVGTKFSDECSLWPTTGDHTTGTGNFLIIDGSSSTNNVDVWKKTLTGACANQTYTFSFWAKNVYGASGAFSLGFIINNTLVAGGTVSINSSGWTQYSVTWTGTPTSIALRQLTAGEKRDFGIDDIFFGFCPCACNPQ
jgi:hypothetical protein